ncbi:MAG: alpha/beta hydrolase [Chitinophagaceae bacterium]|nr:alpha/beta hydrolase [Chitinophagaceae bacterium]
MKRTFFVFGWLLSSIAVFSQERTAIASLPKVEIGGSQQLNIHSAIVGQEYTLQVFLPGSYSRSANKYPVMYVMDSQWDFPLIASLYGQQYFDGFIPEMIIVGVTWGGPHPNPDSLRARDYTPTREARLPQSGGAAQFLAFLKTELIPFVEKNYRADASDRGLLGCSLGGLFTLYALFTEPGLFKRYIAASPAFGWDSEVIYRYEQQYAENKNAPAASLYMTMGGVERGVSGFEKLSKTLNDRHYPQLRIRTRVLENTGHSGTKGEGFARGLQYVFERPDRAVDATTLNTYVGQYQTAEGTPVELKREDAGLSIVLGSGNRYSLRAANDTDFYALSEFLNLHMVYEGGRLTGFQLNRYGGSQFVRKIIDP